MPVKRGGRYFYTRNGGLQNQSVLYCPRRPGRRGARADRSQRLVGRRRHRARPNGSRARTASCWLYSVQDGGTDWRTVKRARRRHRPDRCRRIEMGEIHGSVSWAKDGSGFYYSRFPEPKAGAGLSATDLQPTRSISTSWARRRPTTGWSSPRPTGPNSTHRPSHRRRPLAGDHY